MKKQYIKPLTCRQHLKTESLLYVTSIGYGGDGNEPGSPVVVDANESGIFDWDDNPTNSGSSFWDEE